MATFKVSTTADTRSDDGKVSLREAIALAKARDGADTIIFDARLFDPSDPVAARTIALTAGQLVLTAAGGPLTIDGDLDDDGQADIVVDAQGASRVMLIQGIGNAQAKVHLDGLVLTGGRVEEGGYGGTTLGGAGLRIHAADVKISASQITSNTVASTREAVLGGGVSVTASTLDIERSVIAGNEAGYGATTRGGGLFLRNSSLTGHHLIIAGNRADGIYSKGGGLAGQGSIIELSSSLIANNLAYGGNYRAAGGGLHIEGTLDLVNSTVSGNRAEGEFFQSRGNGLAVIGAGRIANSTIVANSGGLEGAVFADGDFHVANSIIAGNIGGSPYAPVLGNDIAGAITSNGHNIFSQGRMVGALAGDMILDPEDIFTGVIGNLANHGGPTPTHSLRAGSPAVNAGAAADAFDAEGNPLATDQRGFDRTVGSSVDIGAVEATKTVKPLFTNGADRVDLNAIDLDGLSTSLTQQAFGGGDTVTLSNSQRVGILFRAGGGDDRVNGGTGDDLVDLGGGNDVAIASRGDDSLRGRGGVDSFDASGTRQGVAVDLAAGTAVGPEIGQDALRSFENVYGGSGDDTLSGNEKTNLLRGLAGDDWLRGQGGDDILVAGTGADRVDGGLGHDVLVLAGPRSTYTVSQDGAVFTLSRSQNSVVARGVETLRFNGISGTDVAIDEFKDDGPILVTNRDDAGPGSLRSAIALAAAIPGADRITFDPTVFAPAVYAPDLTEPERTIRLTTGELNVTGTGGSLIIDGDLDDDGRPDIAIDAGFASRVMRIEGGSDASAVVELQGLRLSNGRAAEQGGGIAAAQADLTIRASILQGHRATGSYAPGGAISIDQGSLAIVDSRIAGNQTYGSGGGGGIAAFDSEVMISRSTVSGNHASRTNYADGGGIMLRGSALSVIASSIIGNSASDNGGGIFGGEGGGPGSSIEIVNSTLSGNQSARGGGVSAYAASLEVRQSTLTANTATGYGGGIEAVIWSTAERPVIVNSIVAGNDAGLGAADISLVEAAGGATPQILSNGANILTQGGIGGALPGDIVVTPASVSDGVLGALADNGGPTPTHALLPGSVAIGGGINADALDTNGTPLESDQTGLPRIAGARVDIGAFEAQPRLVAVDDRFVSAVRGVPVAIDVLANDIVSGGQSPVAIALAGGPGEGIAALGDDGRVFYMYHGPATHHFFLRYSVMGAGGQVDFGRIDGVAGPPPNSALRGSANDDRLVGGNDRGGDLMLGLGGSDGLVGQGGDDVLLGAAGFDTLRGGLGQDIVLGGGGSDTLSGGGDADLFVFGDENGLDTVTDFSTAQGDKLLLLVSGLLLGDGRLDEGRASLTTIGTDLRLAIDPEADGTFRPIALIQGAAGLSLGELMANAIA